MNNEMIYTMLVAIFAGVAVLGGLSILFIKNVLYSVMGLLISLLGVAGIFALMGQDFLAVTQIMVYVGGVLILLVFGIMLTQRATLGGAPLQTDSKSWLKGVLVSVLAFGGLAYLINDSGKHIEIPTYIDNVQLIGQLLMTDYLLPLEVMAVLLLIILIGAIYIAGQVENND